MAPSTTGRDRKATGRKASGRTAAAPAKAKKQSTASPAAAKPLTDPRKKRTSAPDVELDDDALEFIEALDQFKRTHNKPFPSWSEVLYVLRGLGYRKG